MATKLNNKDTKPVLYGFWISPYLSLAAHFLKESNISFHYERVSPYLGATQTKQYRQRNPFAKIPCYQDSNQVLVSESQAICRYLARTNSKAHDFYPCNDPVKCAAVDEKNDFINFSISGPFFNFIVAGAYFPQAFKIKTEEESRVFSLWSVFLVRGSIKRLIDASKMEPFLLGTTPCLADFNLFYTLQISVVFSKFFSMPAMNLMAGDNDLQKFYDAMLLRPATQEVLTAQESELELTRSEIFEKFGESYAGILKRAKGALQSMFGHEV